MSGVRSLVDRAISPVRRDVREDPYLRYLLALALVLAGFGIWFRVPNFAAPDEYSRLLQPMKVAGGVAADPGVDALVSGILDGRALGATFYLYALVLAPMFIVVLASGNFSEFASLGSIESRWELWHATPEWFWTGSILLGRLVTVAVAVGCVYLTYRLGTELRDRRTGRLAGAGLTLSVAFLAQAHLVGEDIPMMFLLLVTILLAARYVDTGETRPFLLGSLAGGLAVAFKLSGGVAVVVLGVALLIRALQSEGPVSELARPRLLLGGLAIGIAAIYVGIPSVLVGGPTELLTRVTNSFGTKTGKSGGLAAPIWYWFARGYVAGLGLPLVLGLLAGAVAGVGRLLSDRKPPTPLAILLGTALAVFLVVYSRWEFVRVRHLVPTFPLLFVLVGSEVSRWYDRERFRRGIRVALAAVFVTSALFVGVAEYQYVTEPRDQATDWLATNADENATVEVYENSIADVGVPHGQAVVHYDFQEERATNTSSLVLNQTRFTDWMLALPEREPDYVMVTANEMAYLDPNDPASEQYPERRAFVRSLLDGEYEYSVVAEYGSWERTDSLRWDFVDAALSPDVEGTEEYVVILARE